MDADPECVDDPAISDVEVLWRYVHPRQIYTDPKTGDRRPMSGTFIDRRMSVDLSSQSNLEAAKARHSAAGVAQIRVSDVRAFGKCVTQKLDPDPANSAHGIVCPQLSDSQAKKLAKLADIWAYVPPV